MFMFSASEESLSMIFCKSVRAEPATKATDDLVGVNMPWVPRFRCSGVELVRERWWEGICPVNLREML